MAHEHTYPFDIKALDERFAKRFGELMLIDALLRTFNASTEVASLAVIAEALDNQAVDFYLKYGFQAFRDNPMKLYLPIKSVEQLCHNLDL